MKIQFAFIDEKSLNYMSVLLNKASLKAFVHTGCIYAGWTPLELIKEKYRLLEPRAFLYLWYLLTEVKQRDYPFKVIHTCTLSP